MSKIKIVIGGLVFAFAVAVSIRSDELKYNPENSSSGRFDNTIISLNNFFVDADLPNEDAVTVASFNAFQTSPKHKGIDKIDPFAKDVFGLDLTDAKRLRAQKQRDFYIMMSEAPLGNQNHVYSESAIRGFYYSLIAHLADDVSLIKSMADKKSSTKELAETASALGLRAISPDLEKLKSLGNAVTCFQTAALLKASPDLGSMVQNLYKVTPNEMSKYFYDKVYGILGQDTDTIIFQGDLKGIYENPNFGNTVLICALQPQIALGRNR